MPYTYEYPHPAVTVDCVVFGVDLDARDPVLKVLLVRRAEEPYAGLLAIPGGFVNIDEDLAAAALRELREETGVGGDLATSPGSTGGSGYVEQLGTFGRPDRDPRERVITVAYFALVRTRDCAVKAGSDAAAAGWYDARKLVASRTQLAFDHRVILKAALARLEAKARYAPVWASILPAKFTVKELGHFYDVVQGVKIADRRNSWRSLLASQILKPAGTRVVPGDKRRTSQLYRFDAASYERAARGGFHFEV